MISNADIDFDPDSDPDIDDLETKLMRAGFVVICSLLLAPSLPAQTSWFPFTLPWDDASHTAIDASDLLIDYPGQDPAAVVDSRGSLRAGADGHFYFEKTGKRARFWGVNFTFNANYPPCPERPPAAGEYPDDRVADKVAQHLAKLGINVVRFHHMDFYGSPDGIWDPRYYPNDTQHLSDAALQRLDYLIYQLRRNGIYVNLNLKVARHYGPGDNLQDTQLFRDPLSFFQGVSHFNARMVELQKDYARKLLAHRNPYTGLTYTEDPVVAFIEIANEDSLFGNMLNDGGLNYLPGVTGALPERYSTELDALWNSWLHEKYGSRQALETAWKSKEPAVDPTDMMRNGGFESGMNDWSVYPIGSASVSSHVEQGAGPDGSAALRVEVTSDGTNWHVQCIQNGHAIESAKSYEVSFYAKASSPGEITIDVMRGVDPWSNYGLSKTVQLTTAWMKFSGFFRAGETDPATVRPTFELGASNNTVWIDKVEFRQVGPNELGAGESFEAGTVVRPFRSELGRYTSARIYDLFRFYAGVDEQYFSGMRSFIKDTLGAGAMVTGTAPWWGFLGDTAVQSKMDYVDGHYYWDHPGWPAGQAWSPTGWTISNTPWVNQLSDFSGLASQAVEGKPFTVSEFNHVFPNRYALEGPLLAAAIANLQDWDAVYMFDYAGSTKDFARTSSVSFFDLAGNPVKLGQMPVCSRIFLGRQSTVATDDLGVELNPDELAAGYAAGKVNAGQFLESKGLDRRTFLQSRLRIRSFDRTLPVSLDHPLAPGSVTASNGELIWNTDNPQASYMVIEGPAVQGAVGFIKGRTLNFGEWEFTAGGASPDHMAVLLQSRDRVPLRETTRMILSIWCEHQNTGMVWNAGHTSVDNRWGGDPPIIRPASVDLKLRLSSARTVRLYPLDERGSRREPMPGESIGSALRFQIDTGRDRSLWYEVEINNPTDEADFDVQAPAPFQLYTDGSGTDLKLGWFEMTNAGAAAVRPTVLLEYQSRGVLTSVVRLPASGTTLRSIAPVIRDSAVDTAVAILNHGTAENVVALRLLDKTGVPRGDAVQVPLAGGETQAFFVREKFHIQGDFEGSLELSAPAPFHSITLRSIVNASGDFAMTPYPLETSSRGPLYFAHLTADSSYSSDVLLWNSKAQAVAARLSFFSPDGKAAAPAGLESEVDVRLLPGELRRVTLPRTASAFFGYARVALTSGASLPAMTAVITRWENGAPASEVGIPATPLLTEELIVLAERPQQRTGLALLNPGPDPVAVELEIQGSDAVAGRTTVNLAGGEKRAFFLFEVFDSLPAFMTARLSIHAGGGAAVLALAGITNERGDFLMASLTGEPGSQPLSPGGSAICPRYATGAGYRTVVFMSPETPNALEGNGQIRFLDTAGLPQQLLFR
jgi:hypothetical protein